LKVETYICSSLAQTVYLRPKYLWAHSGKANR
jgi:hypothetical protein